MYYINNGVPSSVLAPEPCEQMINIKQLLPPNIDDRKQLRILRDDLEDEAKKDYYFTLKKSIGINQQ